MEEGIGKAMSDVAEADETRDVSQRFADVEDELRQGDTCLLYTSDAADDP